MQRIVCDVCESAGYKVPQMYSGEVGSAPVGWASIGATVTVQRTVPFPEPSAETIAQLRDSMMTGMGIRSLEHESRMSAQVDRQIIDLLKIHRESWSTPFRIGLLFEVCASCQKTEGLKVLEHLEKARDAELARASSPSLESLLGLAGFSGAVGALPHARLRARGFRNMDWPMQRPALRGDKVRGPVGVHEMEEQDEFVLSEEDLSSGVTWNQAR